MKIRAALFAMPLLVSTFAISQTAPAGAGAAGHAGGNSDAVISFHGTHFFVFDAGPPAAAAASAPDVILIPGLGCSHDVWKAEAAKLSPHYRLHIVQIRGFAGYPAGANASGPLLQPIADELAQYIEANNLQHPAIIGHSLGGLLALMVADQHPQDVGKIMIVDSLPFYGVLFDAKATVEQLRPEAQGMRRQMLDEPANNFLHDQNAVVAGMVKTPEKRPQVVFWSVNSDRRTLTTAFYEDLTTDLRPDMAKIQIPITMLYPVDPAKQSARDTDKIYHDAYAGAPHVTLIRVDNSAHFIMLDQPEKFDELVQKFLQS